MAKSTRLSKARSTASQTSNVQEAEVVEEKKSGGFETGIAVLTALLLITACVIMDHELGPIGSGLFFGK